MLRYYDFYMEEENYPFLFKYARNRDMTIDEALEGLEGITRISTVLYIETELTRFNRKIYVMEEFGEFAFDDRRKRFVRRELRKHEAKLLNFITDYIEFQKNDKTIETGLEHLFYNDYEECPGREREFTGYLEEPYEKDLKHEALILDEPFEKPLERYPTKNYESNGPLRNPSKFAFYQYFRKLYYPTLQNAFFEADEQDVFEYMCDRGTERLMGLERDSIPGMLTFPKIMRNEVLEQSLQSSVEYENSCGRQFDYFDRWIVHGVRFI